MTRYRLNGNMDICREIQETLDFDGSIEDLKNYIVENREQLFGNSYAYTINVEIKDSSWDLVGSLIDKDGEI